VSRPSRRRAEVERGERVTRLDRHGAREGFRRVVEAAPGVLVRPRGCSTRAALPGSARVAARNASSASPSAPGPCARGPAPSSPAARQASPRPPARSARGPLRARRARGGCRLRGAGRARVAPGRDRAARALQGGLEQADCCSATPFRCHASACPESCCRARR
jgi:hypothetical protein